MDERTSFPPGSLLEMNPAAKYINRRSPQNTLPMEKFTRLWPVGLTLPASPTGPIIVSAMTPRLNVPRTATGPGSSAVVPNALPASYHPPQ